MRKDPLITGFYYHIYNRGVDKRDVFVNENDLRRFILSVKEFNTVEPIGSIKDFTLRKLSDVQRPKVSKPLVSIVCYCFNPNHFHFILKQEVDGGISEFFKRLLGGYTKYFNLIHKRSGSLFQGRFKSNLINDDAYFLKIRPYVNINYLIHDIPKSKKHLIRASDEEYNKENFDLASKVEAENILEFYGSKEKFNDECLDVVEMIREERGMTSLLEDEYFPFSDVGRPN